MKKIVIFDFDETLIYGNSLNKLFGYYSSRPKLLGYTLFSLFDKRLYSVNYKKAIKCTLYRKVLKGTLHQNLFDVGTVVAKNLTPIPQVLQNLNSYANRGFDIWVVTASPELFVSGIISSLGWSVDRVIGTKMVHCKGVLDGSFDVECEWDEKVLRVHSELEKINEKVCLHSSYGNLPQDEKIIGIAEYQFQVKNGNLRKIK
ncbi:hypothetical protein BTO01_08475 [Vibrio jasicida]|uniref:HAD-IB family phosphatase n=1 Tax=Vibrio jasicida TaxID=766224 RepID=UPI000CF48989|nr:HAD-IB family phosphatase [Vibrio jasicida]PQJ71311.1 hypothetical protein BTO01_08475 [Vibrio jasicida]